MEEEGFTTVLQAWDFRPGFNFVQKMQQAATEVERTIAILSPDYLRALYTHPEWQAAFAQDPTGEKGILLPVRVRECEVTGLLAQIIYIDLVGLDEQTARETLHSGVKRVRAKPSAKPPFPDQTERVVPKHPQFPGMQGILEHKDTSVDNSSVIRTGSETSAKPKPAGRLIRKALILPVVGLLAAIIAIGLAAWFYNYGNGTASEACPRIEGSWQRQHNPPDNLLITIKQNGCDITSTTVSQDYNEQLNGRYDEKGGHFEFTVARTETKCTMKYYGRISLLNNYQIRMYIYATDGGCGQWNTNDESNVTIWSKI